MDSRWKIVPATATETMVAQAWDAEPSRIATRNEARRMVNAAIAAAPAYEVSEEDVERVARSIYDSYRASDIAQEWTAGLTWDDLASHSRASAAARRCVECVRAEARAAILAFIGRGK